jgi:hypothetical protein
MTQDIAQFLLREGWAELPIDVTDQAYVEVALRGIGYRQRFTAFRQMAP